MSSPPAPLYHHVARAVRGTLLFRDADEALTLWRLLTNAFPELEALCLMPDHLHLALPHADEAGRLQRVMSGYTQWRNHHRGQRGPVWERHPPPEEIVDADKRRRTIRYILLNPCRKHLVDDPLAWPWSTHRDAVGFAAPPVIRPVNDVDRFHHYVSADGTVAVDGTPLPTVKYRDFTWPEIERAVRSVCRATLEELTRRGPARTLAVKTALFYGVRDVRLLKRELGVSRALVYRLASDVPARNAIIADEGLAACVAAVGDPRFDGLLASAARRAWAPYGIDRARADS